MRIVSLVPSATELLFALGLGDEVIAVTHECDYPPEALELPRITFDRITDREGMSAGEIDAAVRERTERGESIYELDTELLAEQEPDLIVTQALCAVCAVSADDVRALAEELPHPPAVISLDPNTLGEVLDDVRRLGDVTDRDDAAAALVAEAAARIDRVVIAVAGADRPRVAALEWLDPVFVAGHWTPQLIDYAGGEDILGNPGENSERRSWEEVAASEPDLVVVMPCGYDAARAYEESFAYRERLSSLGARRIVAVDASSYFSRPSLRLVDGLELMAHLLHPDRMPEPEASTAIDVELPV